MVGGPLKSLQLNLNRCDFDFAIWGSKANTSIVALGNHLTTPRDGLFPTWVSPFERDGLFWFRGDTGKRLLVKVIAGLLVLASVLASKFGAGISRISSMMLNFEHVVTIKLAVSLLGFLGTHVLWGLILLVHFLCSDLYSCPSTVALATACLSQSSSGHAVIVLIWRRLCLYSLHPWWVHMELPTKRATPAEITKNWLTWCFWIALMLVLSLPATLTVAGKCTPALFKEHSRVAQAMDLSIGALQGALSAFLVPLLARRMGASSPFILMGCANFVTKCMAGCTVFFLDEACLGRWKSWWAPCSNVAHGQTLNVVARIGILLGP